MSKKKKNESKKNKSPISKTNPFEKSDSVCKKLESEINVILEEKHKVKVNLMDNCDSKSEECNCSGKNDVGQKTDLIVLIDTSGSMRKSAKAISDAVSDAIDEAKKTCEPDLKITFLGVDGTLAGTVFYQSHRSYLVGIHGNSMPLAADKNHVGYNREQGANAIEDLSKYADWREGACRAIFYISDEELDSISPRGDFANETAVTNDAITEALANRVTVFAHHLTYQKLAPQIIQNYKDLCDKTGGECYFSNSPDKDEYVKLLKEVICNSCGKSDCEELIFPEINPCISIKWGDSECDCLESSDYETMTITVCNCYTNFKLSNYKISMLQVCDEKGNPVPLLPDGNPSVQLVPVGPYCFGDIPPCSCVSREFMLINKGAKAGKYKIKVQGICYDVCLSYADENCFEFEICKD